MYAIGLKRTASSPPGFTSMVALNADTANTRPSTTDVPLSNTWTELVSATAEAYGALLAVLADNGTLPATDQSVRVELGVGAASSEVTIGAWAAWPTTSAPALRSAFSPIIGKAVASGSRIAARINGTTPGTDNLRMTVHGFIA